MISRIPGHCFRKLPALLLLVSVSFAEPTLVFSSNYDVILKIDGDTGRIQSQAKVRDGHTIPVGMQRHKVEITVSGAAPGKFRADLVIFEKSRGSWFPVNAEVLSFIGSYGIPAEYSWKDAGVELDVAIAVSIAR